MKLLFCPHCQDVLKLQVEKRVCQCGKSWGHYTGELHATIGGSAVPLGFDNRSLSDAMEQRPAEGLGSTFAAFVIPKACPTVTDDGDGATLAYIGHTTRHNEMLLGLMAAVEASRRAPLPASKAARKKAKT